MSAPFSVSAAASPVGSVPRSVPFSVAASVDNHIVRTDEPREPDGKWHPSSLFSCERQAVYEVRGVPKSDVKEPRNLRIMRIGTRIHEFVQEAIQNDPSVRAAFAEVPIKAPDLAIIGHADGLILHDDGTWELLEIKSIGLYGLKYLTEPKPEHVGQARAYAYVLRTRGTSLVLQTGDLFIQNPLLAPVPVTKIRWIYVCRDDMKIVEFTEPVDAEWEREFEDKIARLERYRADGTALPPRLPDEIKKGVMQRNWLCAGYCDFRTRCWDGQDAENEGVEL